MSRDRWRLPPGSRTWRKKSGTISRPALPCRRVHVLMATASAMKASTTMRPSTAMKSPATIVLATAVAYAPVRAAICSMIDAAVSIAARAMIEAVIVVSKVMITVTSAPAMPVGIEMMVEMAIVAKWSPTNEKGRIETPAERAVEDSVSRNVGVTAEIRIPIPTRSVPAAHRISLSPINVGFRGIRGPQAAPAVEIVLSLFFVEFLGFRRSAGAEHELTLALDRDIPVSLPNDRLALVNAEKVAIGVEIVQAGLEKTLCFAMLHDDEIVLRVKLRNFDGGAALVQPNFRVGQAGRNHGHRAVVTESQESTRRQKNLRFTNLSIQRLTRLQFSRTYCLGVEGLACDRGMSFDIIYTSWACRVCAIGGRRQRRSQDEARNCYQP